MLGQCGRQSENHTLDLAITSQPDLHSPPTAPIANLAAPKVITSSMALISFGHCSHQRFRECHYGKYPGIRRYKGNPQ